MHDDSCTTTVTIPDGSNEIRNYGNGGFTSSDWSQYVVGSGYTTRVYSGTNNINVTQNGSTTTADTLVANNGVTYKVSMHWYAGNLTQTMNISQLYVNINGTKYTLNQAKSAGLINNIVVTCTPNPTYTPYTNYNIEGGGSWPS